MFSFLCKLTNRLTSGLFSAAASPQSASPMLRITRAVLKQIEDTIGGLNAEHGGMLGGSRDDFVVRHYHFDQSAQRSGATYSPDHAALTHLLQQDWNPRGIHLLGFVHSHPPGLERPSEGDRVYAERILKHNQALGRLHLPIVLTKPDNGGKFRLLPFAAVPGPNGARIEPLQVEEVDEVPTAPPLATFARVKTAYDLPRLARCRVIYVGTGGAAAFAEDLVRAGVGEHVLIDPDVVTETNLATQQVYRRDLGRPKVECLGERLRDINPQALVVQRQNKLEEIDDTTFQQLATEPLGNLLRSHAEHGRPNVTLLCGLTDNFEAQARVNRLALHFGLPSLCAQLYKEGRGAEITFTYPGVTPACHRCLLGSRYKAYLKEGFRNDVGSDGTPIFATTYLNGLKGQIAMALLHHGTDHPRWGNLLARIGNRNLVQIRMDPNLELPVFGRVFAGCDLERVLFGEPVWLPQKADCPENGYPLCPDCGGTGDLRKAVGTMPNTLPMRQ